MEVTRYLTATLVLYSTAPEWTKKSKETLAISLPLRPFLSTIILSDEALFVSLLEKRMSGCYLMKAFKNKLYKYMGKTVFDLI